MKLKIKVTKEILEESKDCPLDVNNCAIARAVRDIFPFASISDDIYPFYYDRKLLTLKYNRIPLPAQATDFMAHFDFAQSSYDRANMPEIEFEIDIPEWVIEKINIDELRPLLTNHKTLELI